MYHLGLYIQTVKMDGKKIRSYITEGGILFGGKVSKKTECYHHIIISKINIIVMYCFFFWMCILWIVTSRSGYDVITKAVRNKLTRWSKYWTPPRSTQRAGGKGRRRPPRLLTQYASLARGGCSGMEYGGLTNDMKKAIHTNVVPGLSYAQTPPPLGL